MGSSGSGNISDYPGSSGGNGGKGGGAGGGGGQPQDRCERAFSVELEDIEHSEYYKANQSAPKNGEALQIRQDKRLVAVTQAGETVGNIPTSYNYLAACLKDGWTYAGNVTASSTGTPVATVHADFAAIPDT